MTPTLDLPAELTIYAVAELRPQWLAWMAATDDDMLDADAAAVSEVDAAGLQLVLSLVRALERDGRTLTVRNPSATFTAACRTLGLDALLDSKAEA